MKKVKSKWINNKEVWNKMMYICTQYITKRKNYCKNNKLLYI